MHPVKLQILLDLFQPLSALINQVLDAGDSFGQNNSGEGVHILVEWVSANPTSGSSP